ncbi:hypothetical protein B0A55_07295 [Friedmanniomyces simplex]|uniref:Major facilitator superfamily (MFS) profile domain-containing protein n=1 Tax=Friedmanniomyces simplex TaxID=329884 RepID=A0A4U0XCF1_9PEZI|nr:hypothetical protein B0A55_07295 [Friedmanniomyces simplex]
MSTVYLLSSLRRDDDAIRTRHLEADATGTVTLPDGSPAHPRQWPLSRRLFDSALSCLVDFFTTLFSNSGSSMVDAAMPRLGVGRLSTMCCLTTVYLLGQGVGGLVLPAITESFGSKYIYIASTLGYAQTCLIIELAPSLASKTVCRLLSGILSAMPTAVARGTIENIWDTSERVWMIYFLLWDVFNLATIVLGLLALLCCFTNESRPALVLQHHIRVLQKPTHFPLGFASLEFDYVLSGFLTDLYGPRAASANAAICSLRAVVGGMYYLFRRELFLSEGLGGASGATFVLAGVGPRGGFGGGGGGGGVR